MKKRYSLSLFDYYQISLTSNFNNLVLDES